MAGYIIRRSNSNTWKVLDRKSGEQIGEVRSSDAGYRAESERLKMQAEASDPWLILRMVFNSEEFHLEEEGNTPLRVTAENVRNVLRN
jgi:hypothetical protein